MSKIIVEDLTAASDPDTLTDTIIDSLASLLTIDASSLGMKAGLTKTQIVLATIQASEEMIRYLLVLGEMNEEESKEIRQKAVANAEKRLQMLEESGTIDAAKQMMEEVKKKDA